MPADPRAAGARHPGADAELPEPVARAGPYAVRPNERDLARFLDDLSGFLSFSRDEIGGEFLTLRELRRRLSGEVSAEAAPAPQAARPENAASPGKRCLVVATRPPVHGGSAVVYDCLARFGHGRVSVLAPREDYRFGWPIRFWRE